MSKIRRHLVTGLTVLLSLPAFGATIHRIEGGVLLSGEIVAGDFQRVRSALDSLGNVSVFLNSPGGRVSEALRIAELMRLRRLSTHVPANAQCASACVLIFAGGIVRTADRGARIGVHMGSGLLNDDSIAVMRETYRKFGAEGAAYVASRFEQAAALSVLKQVNFYLSSGISLRLLQISASVEHLEMKWLSYVEAREYNLVNAD